MVSKDQTLSLCTVLLYIGLLVHFSPRVIDDTILQTARAVSYQKGYGFTQAYSYGADISQAQHTPDTTFAPGVEYLIAVLMRFFSMSFSIWLSSIIALSLVLFGCCILLNQYIPQPKVRQNWIFWSFFVFSPVLFLYCGVSDLFSLGFFLTSVSLAVFIANASASIEKRRLNYFVSIAVALTAYMSCFFRYAYYLFFWIPFLLLLVNSIMTKNTWRYFFLSSFSAAVLMFLQLINRSGGDYLKNRHPDLLKTWHWDDLGQITNFVADSYFDIGFVETIVTKLVNPTVGFYSGVAIAVFTIFVTLLILGIWLKQYKHPIGVSKKNEFFQMKTYKGAWARTHTAVDAFIVLTIITNVFSLIAFTVVLGPSTTLAGWTYVEEKRYYAPFAVCLWLAIAKVSSSQSAKGFNLVLALALVTIPLNVMQHILKFKKQSKSTDVAEMYVMSQRLYAESNRINVFVTPDYAYRYADHAAMGGAFLCNLKLTEQTKLIASKPVDLYIPLPGTEADPKERQRLSDLVSRFHAKPWMKVSAFGTTTIYKATLEVNNEY